MVGAPVSRSVIPREHPPGIVCGLPKLGDGFGERRCHIALDTRCDATNFVVHAAEFAHRVGQFFGAENDEPDEEQDDDLTTRQVEHGMSLRSDPTATSLVSIVVIGFAHRGAKAYAPENTLEAFTLALRLGATGLESDVWLTADDVPVLDHDGVVKGRFRTRQIRDVERADLPGHIPSLGELLAATPADLPLSLDLKFDGAFGPMLEEYRLHRPGAEELLYVCHPDLRFLTMLRPDAGGVNLVHSTRLVRMKQGPERHAALLREVGVGVVNMPYPDWTGGLVALFHRFDIGCFAWDCQHERQISEVVRMDVDAVYSDWPDRLADGLRR